MVATLVEAFVKTPSTATAEIDGQLVALDIQAGICFGLDPIATTIWKLLDEHSSVSGVCDALLQIYEVDRTTCEEQTTALLHELADIGLVERA